MFTGGAFRIVHCSSAPRPVCFISNTKTLSAPLSPSLNFSYSWSPKKDAEMPKSGAHTFFSPFFFSFSTSNHVILSSWWSLRTTLRRTGSLKRSDVSFLVLGLSSKPQALVVRAHTQFSFCSVCGWRQDQCSLGNSNTGDSE